MDEKNRLAVRDAGVENLLTWFVNLPDVPSEIKQAEDFRSFAGELIDTRVPLDRVLPSDYYMYVRIFRRIWEAETPEEKKRESAELEGLFNRNASLRSFDRPELSVDLCADQVLSFNFESASLCDWLGWTLIHSRGDLGICRRRGNGCAKPYFLKSHGRQEYCSACADISRSEQKKKWWQENRERHLKKWRRKRKKLKAKRKRNSAKPM